MELAEAADFYEGESTGLGEIFVDAVEAGVLAIQEYPASARKVSGGVRMFLLPRFPYSLVYRDDGQGASATLFVLAVAHHKRRPRYWAERL